MAILYTILMMSPIWLGIAVLMSPKGSEQRARRKSGLGIVLGILSPFLLIAVLYGVVTLLLLFHSEPDGPEPQIWKAEFPFTLSYTLNGEPITVEDTMNCSFLFYSEDYDKKELYRVWTDSYGSRNSHGVTLYKQENAEEYYDGTQWVRAEETIEKWDAEKQYDLKIRLWVGDPSYYMGDAEEPSEDYPQVRVGLYESDSDLSLVSQVICGQDIYDSPFLAAYGIQIIDLKVTADPIENSFPEP